MIHPPTDESYPPNVAACGQSVVDNAIFSLMPVRVTLSEIMQVVCTLTKVSRLEFEGPFRPRHIVRARHIYFYMARHLTRNSFPQIARRCGDRDHTTAMHGYRKVTANLAQYADTISDAKKLLRVSE